MSWRVGTHDASIRLTMEPEQVLMEYDLASTFTTCDQEGNLYLAHWLDEGGEDSDLFAVVPTSEKTVASILSGALPLREALGQTWIWVARVARSGETPPAVHRLRSIEEIESDALPSPGFCLAIAEEPALRFLFQGPALTDPRLSIVSRTIESTQKSIRKLAAGVSGQILRGGRPQDSVRRLYDLPVAALSLGSLQIDFKLPPQAELNEDPLRSVESVVEDSAALLEDTTRWIDSGENPPDTLVDKRTGLEALLALAPSEVSGIDKVWVSGRLIRQPIAITAVHRTQVRAALKGLPKRDPKPEPEPMVIRGRIRELDRDVWTFTIRNDDNEHLCVIAEEFESDEVLEAFTEESFVEAIVLRRDPSQPVEVLRLEITDA